MERIYYDVTIDHYPDKCEKKYKFSSKAQLNINLDEPLIDDPFDYYLSIAKFKIDTESLPLMIPEMMQPQPNLTDSIYAGLMRSTYYLRTHILIGGHYTEQDDNNHNFQFKPTYHASSKKYLHFAPNARLQKESMSYPYAIAGLDIDKTTSLDENFPIEYLSEPDDDGNRYINNTSDQCFIYSYQDFINSVNKAIIEGIQECVKAVRDNADANNVLQKIFQIQYTLPLFFQLINGILYFNIHRDMIIDTEIVRFQVDFSMNLYKYIGNGFNCKYVLYPQNETCWRIAVYDREIFPNDIAKDSIKLQYIDPHHPDYAVNNNFERPTLRHIHMTEFAGETTQYTYMFNDLIDESFNQAFIKIPQEYSTLANWNIVKGIIIGSTDLPVVEEYVPSVENDGFLTHYDHNDYEYKRGYQLIYGSQLGDIRKIEKRVGQKVLDIYYPLSSTAGDIRSTAIMSVSDIEDGQKIQMYGEFPLQRFNIFVKWIDTYGNIHDLYLYPGCSVDIRLCFTRKNISRDELSEGISTIIEKIPDLDKEKKEKEEEKEERKRKQVEDMYMKMKIVPPLKKKAIEKQIIYEKTKKLKL